MTYKQPALARHGAPGLPLYRIVRPLADGYDEAYEFIVAAPTSHAARRIVAKGAGDEGAGEWLSSKTARCTVIAQVSVYAEAGVICRDFAAA